jgi:glucose-6-phosphate isomerase
MGKLSKKAKNQKLYNKRYQNGYLFLDQETGFQVDLAGYFDFKKEKFAAKKIKLWEKAYKNIINIENGEIVNRTKHPKESENRAVDHYNLRMKNSPLESKSWSKSIEYWSHIKTEVEKILSGGKYQSIIFNGIGGSFLGPLLLLTFGLSDRYNQKLIRMSPERRIFFTANTDPVSFSRGIVNNIQLDKCLVVHISKSGTTAETRGNLEAFRELFTKAGLKFSDHNIAITTKGSSFDKPSEGADGDTGFLRVFYMNRDTGGRTSISSAVGMVLCAFAGLDFSEFLNGMSAMDELTRRQKYSENPAALIASAIFSKFQKHEYQNMVVLGYRDSLKEYAHYLQQLYMESLGKSGRGNSMPLCSRFRKAFGIPLSGFTVLERGRLTLLMRKRVRWGIYFWHF